jgi:predicted methyltransferase
MNTLKIYKLCFISLIAVFFALAGAPPARAQRQQNVSQLQTETLDRLAAKATEVVNVQIDERLLSLGSKFLDRRDKDEAQIKEMIKNLKGIYVKSFEFDKENQYTNADIEALRAQLRAPQWSRIVEVHSKRDGGNAEVYVIKGIGDRLDGLAVLSFEPKELTVVNIVGPIDLDKLSQLGGRFGVPQLNIEFSNKDVKINKRERKKN